MTHSATLDSEHWRTMAILAVIGESYTQGSVKKSSPAAERFEVLVNKARNESQKSVLLRYVLDKTMSNCGETVQHARELCNLTTTRPKKAA